MTENKKAKDEAKKLIKFFNPVAFSQRTAVSCAIVCVNELIQEHTFESPISWNIKRKEFWESVKAELIKINS